MLIVKFLFIHIPKVSKGEVEISEHLQGNILAAHRWSKDGPGSARSICEKLIDLIFAVSSSIQKSSALIQNKLSFVPKFNKFTFVYKIVFTNYNAHPSLYMIVMIISYPNLTIKVP